MSEELIIKHCSPTLAGMKTGSMFSCNIPSRQAMNAYIRSINKMLVHKGVRAIPLKINNNKALIYLYRPKQLKRDFSDKEVKCILADYGYNGDLPERCILRLISKLSDNKNFPHEIGLFLGYPAEDVIGFINNKASLSKCSGYWKVYGDSDKAQKLFKKYKKCTDVYINMWQNGRSIDRLTVKQNYLSA